MTGICIHAVGMKIRMVGLGIVILCSFWDLSAIGQYQENQGFQKLLVEVYGDLDHDQIDEKIEVFDTSDSTAFGTVRIISISKKVGDKWVILEKSENAIFRSQEGGMVGEPLKRVTVENGLLVIEHHGGSGWIWGCVDKYRYRRGSFELIFFSTYHGQQGEYWQQFDFETVRNKVTFKRTFEEKNTEGCNGLRIETEHFRIKNPRLTIKNRNLTDQRIVSPKYKINMYL